MDVRCFHIFVDLEGETWPLRSQDVKRLSVFDHRCLRSIARLWWEHRISIAEVRRMVFGRNNSSLIDELITLHRLRWLGHLIPPFPIPPLNSPLTVVYLRTNLSAPASNAQLPTSPPQIIGERNCDSYNHCTISTRFLELTMMMMMKQPALRRMQLWNGGSSATLQLTACEYLRTDLVE
ncbi:hypothetical protein CSKR_201379 [Clonorchis sinensis]|uniref:Uncharacterized protein n=1 Tax=Clonorchis sinensis TaxID=79923 RepID=A0A3R7D7E6_CLOSI|nr:hypothetical protein CSKR_201379 [Clonorchis sinensis]